MVWMPRPSLGFGIGFNSLKGLGFVVLIKRNEPAISHLGRCASMRLLSSVDLGFPSTHSSWSF